MKKKIKIGNKTLIAEMAYGPGIKDPEAMSHVAVVKEAADQFEKAIDERIKAGESEKRSIMTDKSVTSYVTVSEKNVGSVVKEKLKDVINELNIRYKAAGWKNIEIKKIDGGYSVTLISALTDKDKEDMIKMNEYTNKKSGVSESKITPAWTAKAFGILENTTDNVDDESAIRLENTLQKMFFLDTIKDDNAWPKALKFVAEQNKADLSIVKEFIIENWKNTPEAVLALYAINKALKKGE